MDENFKRFKKKVWIEILIKCLSCGLAASFLAVDAVLLPCRLFGINLFWLYYVLIALGGFLLGGGIAFLIFRTDDKKIAMRLDRELNLEERVQTAYTFRGQESDMLEMQRLNTSTVLGGISLGSLHFANLAAVILSGIIALSGIVGAGVIAGTVPPVFAPKSEGPVIPEEPPRNVTDWEWAALDELINYVKTTKKADAEVKAGMLSELEDLRNVLMDGVSQSSLSLFVQNTVTNINNVVRAANEKYEEGDEQADLNNEDENYVINKLYEIFSLKKPGGDDNNDDNPKENPDEGKLVVNGPAVYVTVSYAKYAELQFGSNVENGKKYKLYAKITEDSSNSPGGDVTFSFSNNQTSLMFSVSKETERNEEIAVDTEHNLVISLPVAGSAEYTLSVRLVDEESDPGHLLGGNDVPFFDPEDGYTTAGQSRDKYYELVQKAFEEGTISREEWEYIMATYFADLSKDE